MGNKMYENVKTIRTTYRRLENLLYLLGIRPLEQGKEWDGSIYWVFEDTPQVRLVAKTLKELEANLRQLNMHE